MSKAMVTIHNSQETNDKKNLKGNDAILSRHKLDIPLNIVQLNHNDIKSGADKIAWNLFQAYRARGHRSKLVVGYKYRKEHDPDVLLMPNDAYRSFWARTWLSLGDILMPLVGKVRGAGLARYLIQSLGQPRRFWNIQRGHEDFEFPGTWHLLELLQCRPDIIQCHSVYTYFDLRALAWLSNRMPVLMTMHDPWLLGGHCIHFFDCDRWKTGCGQCPSPYSRPAIKKDASAYNWQRKREIFTRSHFYIATPSRWLMRKVEQSMLVPAIVESKVIPNGVDLSIFHPASKKIVRTELGIQQNAKVLLFTSNAIRRNPWKDYQTLKRVVARVAEQLQGLNVLLIALGEDAPMEQAGQAKICFVPYQENPADVARYYQAADVYIHAAKADTFPTVVIEALACGTPVVATAVGGVPEQIKSLDLNAKSADHPSYNEEATGVLTAPGKTEAMAEAIVELLNNPALQEKLSRNAVEDAKQRFDLKQQVDAYLRWYQEIRDHWQSQA